MEWETEAKAGGFFSFVESGDLPIKSCVSLCCVHHTLLSLQIDGAKTQERVSPLRLYLESVTAKADYYDFLRFGDKELMPHDETFEDKTPDSDYEEFIKQKLDTIPQQDQQIPKNRIFCANRDPKMHTWFANQSGLVTDNIFTSLNAGQSPGSKGTNVNLSSIMRGNGGPTPYPLTYTLYSDIFVAREEHPKSDADSP